MQRDVLESLLSEGMSLDATAARVGRSPSTVSYWLGKHGLRANGADRFAARGAIARDALAPLVAEGLSVPRIAARLGISPAMVRRWLRHHGLETRQTQNRRLARVALASGARQVELICARHGLTTHVLEHGRSYRCSACRAERVAEHRRRVKRLLLAEAGGRCAACGYDRCEAALQFHHLDPAEKEFHLSLRGITRSLDRVRAEARKCVVLCATCHAEVEAGFTQIAV